jgi:hypothetical protein
MKSGIDQSCHSRQRPVARCPFYGFAWPAASRRLLHEGGNRCGLALDRVEPCVMEEAGLDVDMEACPTVYTFAHFIRSAGPVIAFVTPDHPEGLPYDAWWRRTMLEGAIEVKPQRCSPDHRGQIGPTSDLRFTSGKS